MSYSIPSNLKGHVDLIHPTISITKPPVGGPLRVTTANLTSDAVPASCNSVIAPACLQALYNIPTTIATQSSNSIAVSGFDSQWAEITDLKFRPDLPANTTFAIQLLDGGIDIQNALGGGIEADLDVEYTAGVASGVPVTFISVGSSNTDGISGFLDLANFLLSESKLPTVFTTSYAFNEQDVSASIAIQLCNAYMQLGARGTSVFFASGGGGVGGVQLPPPCGTSSTSQFVPTFPSTCHYVTSVGSTKDVPEIGADFTAGGFSNLFAGPSYQSNAVSTYLGLLGSTNAGEYNTTGRGFPDVSTQGQEFQIVYGFPFPPNQPKYASGTSASSPTFASVIALLNDELIFAGKSPLGFLNPLIYSAAGAASFNDITSGTAPGCGSLGFPALVGWDPITGLGTPNCTALKTAVGL